MGKTLFIEDLSEATSESTLRELLEEHGTVTSISIADDDAPDKQTKVAFVDMRNGRQGRFAIAALNGREVDGNVISVKPLKQRSSSGGHGGAYAGGGGGRSEVFGAGGRFAGKGGGKGGGRNR
ncbi:MAG: RNA-binding protein [Lentisphaerae bacterium]|jgi:RNA recognition motif-containing protein|nr:RNA-binding protein [Lentisphaerota bacterium]MBT4821518.1 RNA-binding protein [Lentisphaerota bacterium]MBT5609840.1 RNA-binding protein [Lentisphaerota bacterium]MBT7054391.1 RNA-binding protein [Lentisphaerota bacterium]MBT7846635.1 RNA-binding protein [Lentisphaerota bacterium]